MLSWQRVNTGKGKQMIRLGEEVRCTVTGFKGIAVSRIEYLNGCVQYCVRPKAGDDGKMPEAEYLDQQQLEVIGKGINVPQRDTGGPADPRAPKNYRG